MLPRRDLRVNVSRNPCVGIGPVVGAGAGAGAKDK